jgi:hypothetical protein
MTIIEMHELCDLLLDKADSPWFSSSEKDKFLNLAQAEYVESRYRFFEQNERIRKALIPLVRQSTGAAVSEINLDLIPDLMFTLSLAGEFNLTCGTGTTWNKIYPIQLDDEFGNDKDPFNKIDDTNPGYTEGNNGTNNVATIISDNAPLNYVLKFLKRPIDVFLDENDPLNNVNSEMPVFTHEEIVNIAVRKMMATTEQQLNYQFQQNEIAKEN